MMFAARYPAKTYKARPPAATHRLILLYNRLINYRIDAMKPICHPFAPQMGIYRPFLFVIFHGQKTANKEQA